VSHRKIETKGYVYVAGQIRHQTDRAVLFYDGTKEVWIAKTLIEDPEEFEAGETVELLLPEWLAVEKKLI
jgi:hypothetical protein